MKVKQLKTENIYTMLKDWWLGNNFVVVSPSLLPNTTFVCYNDEGIPVYSMCFYHTDSKLCWVGWQLKNPDKGVKNEGCFKYLFESIQDFAKKQGYQVVFTTSSTPPVQKLLNEQGFAIGDTNVNHYIKQL